MNSYKTAIVRKTLSAPAKFLTKSGLIKGRVLDYGCGRGNDADTLGFDKYDPHFFPDGLSGDSQYDTIVCNYVLNTLPKEQWQTVIDSISTLLSAEGRAYISVRNDKKCLNGVTSKGTYQTLVELDLPIVAKNGNFIIYLLRKN